MKFFSHFDHFQLLVLSSYNLFYEFVYKEPMNVPPVQPTTVKGFLNPRFGEGIDGYQSSWCRKELTTLQLKP